MPLILERLKFCFPFANSKILLANVSYAMLLLCLTALLVQSVH